MGEWHGGCVLGAFTSMKSSGGALKPGGYRNSEVGEKTRPALGPKCHVLWVKVASGSVPGRGACTPPHFLVHIQYPHSETTQEWGPEGLRPLYLVFRARGRRDVAGLSPGKNRRYYSSGDSLGDSSEEGG